MISKLFILYLGLLFVNSATDDDHDAVGVDKNEPTIPGIIKKWVDVESHN